jgi:hypothetical protein
LISCLAIASNTVAAPFSVLWWDSTPEYSGQAPNALRQEMSDYLTNYDAGSLFDSNYVGSEVPGTLAAELGVNNYDVIVFDATSQSQKFNAADLLAVQDHYAAKSNLLLDGSLYIRSINFVPETDFPGPNAALGGLTINEINQLASRGGGIMIGTDHNCCQTDANQILNSLLPSASFSGVTIPSTDGIFFGEDLLNDEVAIAALDVFTHWDAVPTQAIAPTGDFVDFLGNDVSLYSQVDVADKPGGGPKFSYISTSWKPGDGETDIDDGTPGGDVNEVPAPTTLLLLGIGALGLRLMSKKHR